MPTRCVVGGCSNVQNLQEGIALHMIRFHADDRPKSKKAQDEMGRLREVKTFEAGAIQDFGDLLKAF